MLQVGAPWRDLRPAFGRWHTVYMRFARWQKNGVWERVFQAVRQDADLEEVFIDSTAVRAHPQAAGAPKKTARSHWVDLAVAGAPRST
jgi:transposase